MNDANNFEWDNDKAIANWQKHGVSFHHAIKAFNDQFAVERFDEREHYGEERINLIGMCDGTLLHITYTEQRIVKTETQLIELLELPEFAPYLKVFKKFGFGITNQAQLLCKCYPFDKFLVESRPWVEWEETDSGKHQKRHRSLRSFQAYLGLS